MKEIYIIGAGTYGEAMYELAETCGYKVIGYLDEDDSKLGTDVMGVKVIGKFSEYDADKIKGNNFIVAIGNNKTRCAIMTKINDMGGSTPTLIHPTAKISPTAEIGIGCYIQLGAVIWTKVKLGRYTIVSPNTVIAHHTTIGKACLISTLSTVGASINIGDYCFFGIGSIVITGVHTVCRNVMLGAGTTVTKDVTEDNALLVGSPARKIRDREPIGDE